MENAMSDVRERNMTLRGAAKKNSVPYSTLKDRIQGRVMHGTKPGVKTVLSPEEENDLVLCIQVFHRICTVVYFFEEVVFDIDMIYVPVLKMFF